MKTILVTTDFSHDSTYTLNYVLDFIKETNVPCEILLVNTYIVQQTDPKKIMALNDELKAKSKRGLEEQRSEALLVLQNPNISIEIASHMGSLTNVLDHMLSLKHIDMIAMGKNGGRHVESVSVLLKQKNCSLLITYAEKEHANC